MDGFAPGLQPSPPSLELHPGPAPPPVALAVRLPLLAVSSSGSSSVAVDDTMEDDWAWLDDFERRRGEERRLEKALADVSMAGNRDVGDVLSVADLDVPAGLSGLDRLPEVVLADDTVASLGETICQICLEIFRVGQRRMTLPCMHAFHSDCVKPWLVECKDECPVCRSSVSAALGISAFSGARSLGASSRVAPGVVSEMPGLFRESLRLEPDEPTQEELQARRLRIGVLL